MQKKEFEREIGALIPLPDADTTSALYQFGLECGQNDAPNMGPEEILTALGFIARNFDRQVLQGTYEIIRHGSAALASEMVAAAVYLQNGGTPKHMAQMAHDGLLMCFHTPDFPEEDSPLAICSVIERGEECAYYSLHFGSYQPEAAFRYAQGYALQHGFSVNRALRSITTDLTIDPCTGEGRKILQSSDPRMMRAMFAIFKQCPAIAAHVTFDADRGHVTVEHNPLWLKLKEEQEPSPLLLRM